MRKKHRFRELMKSSIGPTAALMLAATYPPAFAQDTQQTESKAQPRPAEGNNTAEVAEQKNVMVPMRDGVKLAADIYLPSDADKQNGDYPTLVMRTPYDKISSRDQALFLARHGYAVVIQDVRGLYHSEGEFYPYRSQGHAEGKDSYDTVEWAAKQSWSDGHVGTFGISYRAGAQMALAGNPELPPHLDAMAPGYVVASYYGQGAYAGGAMLLSHNLDYLNLFGIETYDRSHPDQRDSFTRLDQAQEAMPQLLWNLPVRPYQPFADAGIDWLNEGWLAHPTYDDYWKTQNHRLNYGKIDVPVLVYGGWYDIFDQGDVQTYLGLKKHAANDSARGAVRFVMGPYTHGKEDQRCQGETAGHAYCFEPNAVYSENKLLLNWFDRHLKDKGTGIPESQTVRLYVPGLDEWVAASDYPLPKTDYVDFYLSSAGDANVSNTRYPGRLKRSKPDQQPPDQYVYDPSDPVRTIAGFNTHTAGGVGDRTQAYGNRDDILVYETPVLDHDVAVVGPITLTLYASTSAVDTDFDAVISDVDPNARTGGLWVTEGIRRGSVGDVSADPRQPETYTERKLLKPGKIYEWKIAVWPTARVFEKGHRIRIDIASSNFPRYNRNLNTGAGLSGKHMVSALQTIYHDAEHASHVTLPIVPMAQMRSMVSDGPAQ